MDTIALKFEEIRKFFTAHEDQEIVKKYARYFREGFDGYGINQKVFENQRDQWIRDWKPEMSMSDTLALCDRLMNEGRYEEKSMAIALMSARSDEFSRETFDRIGEWFESGVDNWATCDVLCMQVTPEFIHRKIISPQELKAWNNAASQWQRRVVPVTLYELCKTGITPEEALPVIEPLMSDDSEYVQKGLGTLLRELWKKHPETIENFLHKWKKTCGRKIIQYATEKMDKEYRKQFRRTKK